MNVDAITTYLKNAVRQFALVVPPNHRVWSDVKYHDGRVNPSTRPDLYEYIVWGQSKITSFTEFSSLLESDTDYKEFYAALEASNLARQTWTKPYSIAINLLEEYLNQVTQITYDHDVAKKISENFVNFVKSKKSTLVMFSVVRGLTMDFNEIVFDEGTKLRKISDEESSILCRQLVDLHANDNFPQNNIVVEHAVVCQLGVYDTNEPHRVMDIFDQIVLALQLLRNEKVSREYMYHYYPFSGELGQDVDTRIYRGKATKRPARHSTYELHQSEIGDLTRIVKLLDNPLVSEKIETCIKRFNGAAIRIGYEYEDMLLDLFIALEALYDSVAGSSGYSIRMRAAALLEGSLEDRQHTIYLIKDGYDCRSKIVHGSKYKKTHTKLKLDFEELVDEIYNLTRKSIVKVLEFGALHGRPMVAMDFDNLLLS
ncbi:MAG: hypothetical protein WEC37_00800 [Anaerolineales bacterium]